MVTAANNKASKDRFFRAWPPRWPTSGRMQLVTSRAKPLFKVLVYGHTGHTHASCNAVQLVWGSLRLTPTSLSAKNKTKWKKKMRTKFKLCYKEGFKLSGSTSFELRVRNNTYLHTTPACQHPTRHMIGRHAPFRFVSQPRQGMFAEPSCYTASYSLVPLSFQPHCKSLLSLERQIVPCLQHS